MFDQSLHSFKEIKSQNPHKYKMCPKSRSLSYSGLLGRQGAANVKRFSRDRVDSNKISDETWGKSTQIQIRTSSEAETRKDSKFEHVL